MKLSQVPILRVEDFDSQKNWIGKLFIQLNPFIQAVNQVLDLNIDFSSNVKAVTKGYSISTFQEFGIQWPYSDVAPTDLKVTKASKGSNQDPTVLLAAWKYDSSNAQITVTNLYEISSTGVSALSGEYQFTVRASV